MIAYGAVRQTCARGRTLGGSHHAEAMALCVKGNVEDAERLMLEDLGLSDLAGAEMAEPRCS